MGPMASVPTARQTDLAGQTIASIVSTPLGSFSVFQLPPALLVFMAAPLPSAWHAAVDEQATAFTAPGSASLIQALPRRWSQSSRHHHCCSCPRPGSTRLKHRRCSCHGPGSLGTSTVCRRRSRQAPKCRTQLLRRPTPSDKQRQSALRTAPKASWMEDPPRATVDGAKDRRARKVSRFRYTPPQRTPSLDGQVTAPTASTALMS